MAGKKGRQTVRDMVLSLAVIGVAVAVMYAFIPHDDSAKAERAAVQRVSYRVELATARRAAPYAVAAPVGLPHAWRATSVSYKATPDGKGGAWHLGFLDPHDQYAAVEQSDAEPADFVHEVTLNAHRTKGSQQVDGDRWVRYEGAKYRALVREQPGVTTVLTGTASYSELGRLAGALQAKREKV
ncbi:DUF4245 domain-containing protein [Streptomyces sp. NPDC059740]|uniref:DUF4245 domain-containing protein n=1 Tax=Streptomyces sp. NPDC059740 TaxID=3346926 RepID=UPI00364FABFD